MFYLICIACIYIVVKVLRNVMLNCLNVYFKFAWKNVVFIFCCLNEPTYKLNLCSECIYFSLLLNLLNFSVFNSTVVLRILLKVNMFQIPECFLIRFWSVLFLYCQIHLADVRRTIKSLPQLYRLSSVNSLHGCKFAKQRPFKLS